MIDVRVKDRLFTIRPVSLNNLEQVLKVYQGCEDFLALGPVATASMEMARKDLEISHEEGGLFCGIHTEDGTMIGVVDYVPRGFQGDPHTAYLSLLMISSSFRQRGIGKAVFKAVEQEIRKDDSIRVLLAGVQVNNPRAVQFWQRRGFRIISGPRLMPDRTTVYELRKDF